MCDPTTNLLLLLLPLPGQSPNEDIEGGGSEGQNLVIDKI